MIWTDVVQSIVLRLGILLCLGTLFSRMPEGPMQVFEIAAESDKFSLGSFGASLSQPTFWVLIAFGLFVNLQNFGIDQSYVQRYATAESEGAARRSVWLGALLYIPISALLFLVGTALFAYYSAQPELLPDTVTKGDQVSPALHRERAATGDHRPAGGGGDGGRDELGRFLSQWLRDTDLV